MYTAAVIGPGVESFTQPEVPPIEASFVGIILDDTPITPGPRVRFRYANGPGLTIYPRVHAVFVPTTHVASALTAEQLLDPENGFPKAYRDRGAFVNNLYEIAVPGLVGGTAYELVTVLVYDVPDPE